MRMSAECMIFKGINDSLTSLSIHENKCQNGMVNLIVTNNVKYCNNHNIISNARYMQSLYENDCKM